MTKLPHPPKEVPASRDLECLAPAFRRALTRVIDRLHAQGWEVVVLETDRSNERASFLFGFGRDYDDGRGVVTNAQTAYKTWHFFRLAADLGIKGHEDGTAPLEFYADLEKIAFEEGLTPGADWNRNGVHDEHFCDRPHVQWYCPGMHVTPSDNAKALFQKGGYAAVWHAVSADV
jgi:hypothetical protein